MREPVSVFMMVLCMNGYQGDDESAVLWYDPAYGLIQCVAKESAVLNLTVWILGDHPKSRERGNPAALQRRRTCAHERQPTDAALHLHLLQCVWLLCNSCDSSERKLEKQRGL